MVIEEKRIFLDGRRTLANKAPILIMHRRYLVPKYTQLPSISGKKLIKLLQKASWTIHGRTKHGVALRKFIIDRTRVTIVPDTNVPLDDGILSAILGSK